MPIDTLIDPAEPFRGMAERIAALARRDEFAGAIVFVPPVDAGRGLEAVDILLTSAAAEKDVAFFWSTVKSKVEIAVAEANQRYMDHNSPYGRR